MKRGCFCWWKFDDPWKLFQIRFFPIHVGPSTLPIKKGWEAYLAIKNILNFTPPANSIWGAHDPFDKLNNSDTPGIDPADPDDLGFDPAYMFAPNQGIRGNFGIRYTFKKWID